MKRSLSILLILALLIGALMLVPTSVSAADGGADTGSSGACFSFDANFVGWQNFSYISFHIWGDNDFFFDWGTKNQRGRDDDGDGIWTYDLEDHGVSLDSSKQYYVIFYADTGVQTYELVCGTACYGDTIYCDGVLDIMDATRIQRYLAELADESELDMTAADATQDNNVDIMDATRIQRVLAELCDIDGNVLS